MTDQTLDSKVEDYRSLTQAADACYEAEPAKAVGLYLRAGELAREQERFEAAAFNYCSAMWVQRKKLQDIAGLRSSMGAALAVEPSAGNFGQGRIWEELALVYRFTGRDEDKHTDLQSALLFAKRAIESYEKVHLSNELDDRSNNLRDRLLRSYGICGMIDVELADFVENPKPLLEEAVRSVESELIERREGPDNIAKANAYHSMGIARGRLAVASEDATGVLEALGYFREAENLATRGSGFDSEQARNIRLDRDLIWAESHKDESLFIGALFGLDQMEPANRESYRLRLVKMAERCNFGQKAREAIELRYKTPLPF